MVHTTLAAVDITAFGDRRHDAGAQLRLRRVMYEQLIAAFEHAGLPWAGCHREDRGDGTLIVAPPEVDAGRFLGPLVRHLATGLRRYNDLTGDSPRLRLRVAVHHGTVFRDAHGVAGPAVLHLFRLLDALAFKRALRAAGPDLGLIVSARLHADTTRQSGLVDPEAYRRLRITNKETRARAWVWLPPDPR